jgi:hypothetical protein
MSKLMFENDQTLLIRSLNSTRQIYFPSYVGLRLIGSQMSVGENNYLQQLVVRRLLAGDTWRFKSFKLYKGSIQTQDGLTHQYRSCLAPSPLTAIAESFILQTLAENSEFLISPRVYSYKWPPSIRSGRNYRYFFESYKQRNMDIAAALDSPNHVAVVTDLKQFYPSANKEQVASVLKLRLDQAEERLRVLGDAIFGFYSQLLATGNEGIPVGPVSGHVLGHLVLQDVDNELTSKYGDNYFRYVDDIVVVCHESDVDVVKREIQDCIEKHGFSINPDKTAVITGEVWHNNILRADISDEDSLRILTSEIATYLVFHPERADELSKMFADAGLCIPVGRLHDLSKYNRFRYFISRRNARSGVSHALGLYLSKNDHFVQRGLRLKSVYESSLSKLIDEPSEILPNLRRWQVQRTRRLINYLFYLRRFNEWNAPDGAFDAFPELLEQRALANALATGTVNSILPFYGSGPAAFSELWAEHGDGYASLLPSESGISTTELDGVITLRLCGVISAESMQFLQNIKNDRLLQTVIQPTLIARTKADLSFEDELESLRLGVSDQEISTLARSRYSPSEGTVLEALSLLSSEYRS